MKNQSSLDIISAIVPKILFFIPIFVLAIAIFFRVQQLVSPVFVKKPTSTPSPAQTSILSPTPDTTSLSLEGPLICQYSDKAKTTSIAIKNKQMKAVVTGPTYHGENLLVAEDCMYKWEPNQSVGEKLCGVGGYLDMYSLFSSLGISSFDAVWKLLPTETVPDKATQVYLNNLTKSCKKGQVEDSQFVMPKGVVFSTNQKLLEEVFASFTKK